MKNSNWRVHIFVITNNKFDVLTVSLSKLLELILQFNN
jgi:hypothetical protein